LALGRCFPFNAAFDFTGVFAFEVAFFVVVFVFGFRVVVFLALIFIFSPLIIYY
jgi:hypothetical protein